MLRLLPQHRKFALAHVAMLCALLAIGCSRYSVVAPPGSSVVVAPPADPVGSPVIGAMPLPGAMPVAAVPVRRQPKLTVRPARVVAPVGSEVVILGSLCGRDGYMMPRQRVDWMIAPNDAGQILTVGDSNGWSLMEAHANRPRKLTNKYAISATAANNYQIRRDACNNQCINVGQAWVSITSPVEGTSRVTGYVPDLENNVSARDTAVVHWVDAQASFPITAMNPVGGRQAMTTTVVRSSNQLPLAGWTVRYQIVGGPNAGFAPGGAQTVDVTTNAAGQATAEIFQPTPARGTNQIRIDVIRPPRADDPDATALVLQSGTVLATWSAAELQLQATGPDRATVDSTAVYQMVVSNAGDLPASDVALEVALPDGITFVSSLPEATQVGRSLRWSLGSVAAREARTIQVDVRADREATVDICGVVTAGTGLTARSCVTTNIGAAAPVVEPQPQPDPQPSPDPAPSSMVRLTLTGPDSAKVGEEVVYRMDLTNPGTQGVENVIITTTFDEGLEHIDSQAPAGTPPRTSPLSFRLGFLEAGATETVNIRFKVKNVGTHCNSVEVKGDNVPTVSQRACLTTEREAPREHAAMTVSKIGPTEKLRVGSKARFRVVVENTGNVPLTNIQIEDNYDEAFLKPEFASPDGYQEADASDNDVVWKFDRLEPGKKVEVIVDCGCLAAVARTCSKVVVRATERPPIVEEACVTIATAVGGLPGDAPPMGEGELSLSLADRSDPVVVGTEMTYEIVVKNEEMRPDTNVMLTVTFPEGLTPVPAMTGGPSRPTIDGQTVRFEPVREVRPGERLPVYRVRVRVDKAGTHLVKAELKSDSLTRPINKAEDTTAYAEQ
ncbi:MAG: DUF11 domain-containing protein [Pirellulales bacterium]|nr:DUF11 domain-containing protein [Pirellulales bacterium]